jgi:hypothetical protein
MRRLWWRVERTVICVRFRRVRHPKRTPQRRISKIQRAVPSGRSWLAASGPRPVTGRVLSNYRFTDPCVRARDCIFANYN